jgi:hypothetical protein
MNPDGVHTWQLPVHRKMLILKRVHRDLSGEISPVVKYWTIEQEPSAWIDRLKHS